MKEGAITKLAELEDRFEEYVAVRKFNLEEMSDDDLINMKKYYVRHLKRNSKRAGEAQLSKRTDLKRQLDDKLVENDMLRQENNELLDRWDDESKKLINNINLHELYSRDFAGEIDRLNRLLKIKEEEGKKYLEKLQ